MHRTNGVSCMDWVVTLLLIITNITFVLHPINQVIS